LKQKPFDKSTDFHFGRAGGGLIFALRALRLRVRSYEHYEHPTSMLKPYEGIVSESSIAGFLYYCHNHLRVARVRGCRAD